MPEVKEHGLGWADPAKVEAMVQTVVEYAAGDKAEVPNPATLFTNQFAGTVKLDAADLARAEASVAPYRKFLV